MPGLARVRFARLRRAARRPTRVGLPARLETGLLAALAFACVDTAIGIQPAPRGLARPGDVAAVVAAAAALYLAGYAALALGLAALGRAGLRLEAKAAHGAGALALALLALTPALAVPPGAGLGSATQATLAAAAGIAALAGLASYLVLRRRAGRPAGSRAALAARALPAWSALGLGWLWLERFAPAAPGARGLRAGAFLLASVAALAAVRALARRGALAPAYACLGAGLLLWGVAAQSRGGDAGDTASAPPQGPRWVILLSVDTLRADALSAYAPDAPPTPHLDSIAADGWLFENATSAGPWTKPAFASMHTGLSPFVHGANTPKARLPDGVDALAERLRDAGYHTAAIGLNPVLGPALNFTQGFDEYLWFPRPFLGPSLGARFLSRAFEQRFGYYPTTTALTDWSVGWIRKWRARPFFLWMHYFDPHAPYAPPRRFLSRDGVGSIGVRFHDPGRIRKGRFDPTAEERDWIRTLYAAEVRYVDEQIGRFLEALRRAELYDDALIVLVSDHGEEFWEHGGVAHGHSLHREVLQVPLVVKLPGSPSRGRIAAPVSTASVAPTILDLCGLAPPAAPQALASLRPRWEGVRPGSAPLVSTGMVYARDGASVVFEGMKYMTIFETGAERIYDLGRDPGENAPLDRPAALERGRRLLDEHRRAAEAARAALGLAGAAGSDEADLDAETIERLRALGYL